MPLRIILDSNFLFLPLQFRMDILEELELTVNRKIEPVLLTPVYQELQKLAINEKTNRRMSEMALKYAEKLELSNAQTRAGETVDDTILRIAVEWKCPVATNDRKLRKRLRDMNVTVIYLRGRSHLAIEGIIT